MALALLSNDDGIGSFYLRTLAEALMEHFEVVVAAPKREQSWIGRAMSRRTPVTVEKCDALPCPAWEIDGTPTDCVNIAMDHLLGRKPDIVVSGINIGYNASIPFILCSGTLGAAIEGSMWGCRALAVSQSIPHEHFHRIHSNNSSVPDDVLPKLRRVATHAASFASKILADDEKPHVVHNLNYPVDISPETPVRETIPAALNPMGLFEMGADGICRFRYQSGEVLPSALPCDRDCIEDGEISHTLLDFNRIGVL